MAMPAGSGTSVPPELPVLPVELGSSGGEVIAVAGVAAMARAVPSAISIGFVKRITIPLNIQTAKNSRRRGLPESALVRREHQEFALGEPVNPDCAVSGQLREML